MYVQKRNVTPDGNCLFVSIANALTLQDKKVTAEQLRAMVSDYIRNPDLEAEYIELLSINMREEEPATYSKFSDEDIIKRYTEDIKNESFWGNNFCIAIISKICETPIIVLKMRKSKPRWNFDSQPNLELNHKYDDTSDASTEPLYVLFNGDLVHGHYDNLDFISADVYNNHENQTASKETIVSTVPMFQALVEESMYILFYTRSRDERHSINAKSAQDKLMFVLRQWWYEQQLTK